MAGYLVFDIETRVDKDLVKDVYDPEGKLTPEEAYDTARDRLLEKSGQRSDFFPVPFHVPISIATLQADEHYRIHSLGCLGADRFSETELINRFWEIFEGSRQVLVTFNGRGFDLPVLEARALKHGISLARYFEAGYRGNRYADTHHIDLCDWMSNFGVARRGSLDVLAKLVGLPGKYNVKGDDVEHLFQQGRQKEINQYCTIDVLQTWVLFLRVELLRGRMDAKRYGEVVKGTREDLAHRAKVAGEGGAENFLLDFLQRWKSESGEANNE